MNARRPGLALRALNGEFGVEALGVDAAVLLDGDTAAALRTAFERHRILVLRDQKLAPAAHVAVSRLFGELEITGLGILTNRVVASTAAH